MRIRLDVLGIMMVILISVLCLGAHSVQAEEVKNLDLVMVLDQSGSMKDNDPKGMMREAAATLASMMPVNISRVSVISFNRNRKRIVDMTAFSNPAIISDVRDRIGEIEYHGDTDIGNAVADAIDLFDLNDGREHAVLVFSDGKNDFGSDKKAEYESDERLNDALLLARKKDCKIYALGFGPELQDSDGVAYKKLRSIATSGDMIFTETEPERIKDFFTEMLADLTGVKIPVVYNNEITIEPNVKEANIYISSLDMLTDVEIGLEGSKGAISLDNNENAWFFKGNYVAVIKLFSPKAGKYKVTTSSDKVSITVGYIPSYEYILKSEVIDGNGEKVLKLENGTTAEIRTVICQNNEMVAEPEVYENIEAKAILSEKKNSDNKKEIPLIFKNGWLSGSVVFTEPAAYSIDIKVESETIELRDHIDVESKRRGVSFKIGDDGEQAELGKKVIDKTFKQSANLVIGNSELLSIIDDPDEVGVTLKNVESSVVDKVTAEIMDGEGGQEIKLTGLKWGSSLVKLTYYDGLGNNLETSFKVDVKDKVLYALVFTPPLLIGVFIVLVAALIYNKSKTVQGYFTVIQVSCRERNKDGTLDNSIDFVIDSKKKYGARVFIGRKKTLGHGVAKYAEDIYSEDNASQSNVDFYSMFSRTDSEIRLALDEVKVIGTRFGLDGCFLKIRKGTNISLHDNNHFGTGDKYHMRESDRFTVYIQTSRNKELCVKGIYSIGRIQRSNIGNSVKSVKGRKDNRRSGQSERTMTNRNDFDDFF